MSAPRVPSTPATRVVRVMSTVPSATKIGVAQAGAHGGAEHEDGADEDRRRARDDRAGLVVGRGVWHGEGEERERAPGDEHGAAYSPAVRRASRVAGHEIPRLVTEGVHLTTLFGGLGPKVE